MDRSIESCLGVDAPELQPGLWLVLSEVCLEDEVDDGCLGGNIESELEMVTFWDGKNSPSSNSKESFEMTIFGLFESSLFLVTVAL